jgi:hypothetical protein
MRTIERTVLTLAFVLTLSTAAQGAQTLYSPPLFLEGTEEFDCGIRNVGARDVVVRIQIVDLDGDVVEEGVDEALTPGEGTARGITSAFIGEPRIIASCNFILKKGARNKVRASAWVTTGPFPNRTTKAAVRAD